MPADVASNILAPMLTAFVVDHRAAPLHVLGRNGDARPWTLTRGDEQWSGTPSTRAEIRQPNPPGGMLPTPGNFNAGRMKSTPVTSPNRLSSIPSTRATVAPTTPPSEN